MRLTAEVTGKFDRAEDGSKLLYAPLDHKVEYRETRRYHAEGEGSQPALEEFLRAVLANETSHELSLGEAPALAGWSACIDCGMKPGALDLEKETILAYYRGLESPSFELRSLRIERRIYLYGIPAARAAEVAEKFARDIVNPAVHRHSVQLAAA